MKSLKMFKRMFESKQPCLTSSLTPKAAARPNQLLVMPSAATSDVGVEDPW